MSPSHISSLSTDRQDRSARRQLCHHRQQDYRGHQDGRDQLHQRPRLPQGLRGHQDRQVPCQQECVTNLHGETVTEGLEDYTDCLVDILACNLGVEHSCRTCVNPLVASLLVG